MNHRYAYKRFLGADGGNYLVGRGRAPEALVIVDRKSLNLTPSWLAAGRGSLDQLGMFQGGTSPDMGKMPMPRRTTDNPEIRPELEGIPFLD